MHVMKGMVAPLEVTTADAAPGAEPSARHRGPAWRTTTSRSRARSRLGRHTFRVENDGPQEHDVTVLEVAPGKSQAEVLAWFNEPAKGAPAARALGGIVGIPRGTHGFFSADFHRGEYILLCFVPDEHDGKPHFQHGMVRRITVS